MSSIREVARRAGVSIATVSRVVNGVPTVEAGLRRRVVQAIEQCDYTPTVGRRAAEAVAVIYAGPFTIQSPYDSACLEGMVEAMRASEHDLTIVDIQRDLARGESIKQFLQRKRLLGGIVRCTSKERGLVTEWGCDSLPLVVLGDHFDAPNLSFVFAPSGGASREAVELLISLGHQRVAFAACERDDGDHIDRLQAYQAVLHEHGCYDANLVFHVPPHRLDGAQLLRNLLSMPRRPTAIYIADPLVAVGAINEAHRLGVGIPEEMSIVGFDDADLRSLVYPQMTAVCQDARLLGVEAVERLMSIISGEQTCDDGKPQATAWLEIGHSTGPAPLHPQRVFPTGARISS